MLRKQYPDRPGGTYGAVGALQEGAVDDESVYPGYEEVGRCNPENYYTCDCCGADEFAFDEFGVSQGWNRMFRRDGRDLCEYCVRADIEARREQEEAKAKEPDPV